MRGDVVFRVYGVHEGRSEDSFFGAFRTRVEAEAEIDKLLGREMGGENWAWWSATSLSCAPSRWNLGALYLLPELRFDRFEQFRVRRAELRGRYRSLAAEVIEECEGPTDADDLPFRLVESVINRRSDDTDCPEEQPWVIADGALRTLGFDGDFAKLHKATAARLGFADTVQV